MSAAKLEDLLNEVRKFREKIQYGASGQTFESVVKATEVQNELKKEVDKLINDSEEVGKQLTPEDAASYKESLESLKLACAKKLKCLETMKSISSLESQCWGLSNTFDLKSVELTQNCHDEPNAGGKIPGFIGQLSQNCIFGVKDNWDAVSNLVRCLDVHLKNASDYHQFHHEVKESERWLNSELDDVISNFEKLDIGKPNEDTVTYFLSELEAIHQILYQWKTKLDRLLKVAAHLVPVNLRTEAIARPLPAISLSNYYSPEVNLRKDEDILVTEGCIGERWKVRNGRGDEGLVPSLMLLLPGPDEKANEALDKLRFILLTYWTGVLKNYGKKLITLLLRIYKPQYSNEEVAILQSLDQWEKDNVLMTLNHLEEVLKKYWASYDGFLTLEERLGVLRVVLEGDADADQQQLAGGENKAMDVVLNSTPSINQMATIYQDLSRNWELFKTTLDIYKHPELMLALEKWQQLQYLPASQVSQFWKTTLQLETTSDETAEATDWSIDGEKVKDEVGLEVMRPTALLRGDSLDGSMEKMLLQHTEAKEYEKFIKSIEVDSSEMFGGQERVKVEDSSMKIKKPMKAKEKVTSGEGFEEAKEIQTTRTESADSSMDFGSITTTERADTEQILTAHQEEKQTFTIKSVVNPADQKDISLDEAIYRGVIVPSDGIYRNAVTGEDIPIPTAMLQGLIKVAYSTRKVEKESHSSVGIITIKSLKEATMPFTIQSVRDTSTGLDLTVQEATQKGLLDFEKNFIQDSKTGKKFTIQEAAAKDLIKINQTGDKPKPEEVIKRYAVRAVVDRKNKKTVTFDEAVRLGLIDKDTGAYYDNVTNEKLYIGDALVKGFLKARQVTEAEARGLNIDPTNQILVDRTKVIRKKIIKPLAAVGAFRKVGGISK